MILAFYCIFAICSLQPHEQLKMANSEFIFHNANTDTVAEHHRVKETLQQII